MQSIKAEDIKKFNDDGYLIVKNALDPKKDLAPLIEEYSNLLNIRVKEWNAKKHYESPASSNFQFHDFLYHICSDISFPRHLLSQLDITLPYNPLSVITEESHIHLGPAVFNLLTSPRILNCIESILGLEILASPDQHTRFKLPHHLLINENLLNYGARKAEALYNTTIWHQDMQTQMPEADESNIITVWVPMETVRKDDGCLVVVPGYHKNQELLPFPVTDVIKKQLNSESIALTVEKGDFVILHKKTPHASLPVNPPQVSPIKKRDPLNTTTNIFPWCLAA